MSREVSKHGISQSPEPMNRQRVIEIEDQHSIGFFAKQNLVIERGDGVWVYTDEGDEYLDFTSGWAVTCLGHAHPVITQALVEQSSKIIQNPNSGLTYSPSRARLLELLIPLMPGGLSQLFFTNSGAEANDAALKLARKITGRRKVLTTCQSFHGRTFNALSVTGSPEKAAPFGASGQDVAFVPFNDIEAVEQQMSSEVAAFIVEPIQGEGGVNIPSPEYLSQVSQLCEANGALLIVDEIQTGFCRTGQFFATSAMDINIDFLTMAKGLGGGFPIGAFAVNARVAEKIERGDHGGTYCGNPLACAVSAAVVEFLVVENIASKVAELGLLALKELHTRLSNKAEVSAVRGKGLLLAIEFESAHSAAQTVSRSLEQRLLVTQTQDNMIRIFPALTIKKTELLEGINRLVAVIDEL